MKTQFFLATTLAVLLSPSIYSEIGNLEAEFAMSNNYSEIYSVEQESDLEIEPWMTNDEIWDKKSDEIIKADFDAVEDTLTIEAWMTDDDLWRVSNKNL